MANFIVTSLSDYASENKDMLLKNFALVETATRTKSIIIQTGVKLNADINYMEVDPVLLYGSGCGFNASGDITLAQKQIALTLNPCRILPKT